MKQRVCHACVEHFCIGADEGSRNEEEDEQGSEEGGDTEDGEEEQEEDGVSQEEGSEDAALAEDALEDAEDARKSQRAEGAPARRKSVGLACQLSS